jgi:hypothetical protein
VTNRMGSERHSAIHKVTAIGAGLLATGSLAFPAYAGTGSAHACSCERTSPAAGFERAQYVFTGKIVEAGSHTWVVELDRVWKGKEKLRSTERLMDVYAAMDCEFSFKLGERYIFFAIVAKSGGDVFYHPQVCNWTSPLRSNRVATPEGASLWLEDFIVREHGPGEPPKG